MQADEEKLMAKIQQEHRKWFESPHRATTKDFYHAIIDLCHTHFAQEIERLQTELDECQKERVRITLRKLIDEDGNTETPRLLPEEYDAIERALKLLENNPLTGSKNCVCL
jgi:hypothetical protein